MIPFLDVQLAKFAGKPLEIGDDMTSKDSTHRTINRSWKNKYRIL